MAYKKLKYWFDKDLALMLANKIENVVNGFDSQRFVAFVKKRVDKLELKDRVEVMADGMHKEFGGDYEKGLSVLMEILEPENEEETGMFSNYYWIMPIAKYVEKYGLEAFTISMNAIEEITKRNTGEYTIRPFIENYPEKTLNQMEIWSLSENKHVRRLSSEGVRPRLPWAKKLDMFIENPSPIIPILNNLKDDTSKYVQKSVANCLNDILKDNPYYCKSLIETWSQKNISKQRQWIIKHSLRNLLKKQDDWAMKMVNNFN